MQGADLTESEEALIHRFLDLDKQESSTLADIIMNKIREKETGEERDEDEATIATIPAKVSSHIASFNVFNIMIYFRLWRCTL